MIQVETWKEIGSLLDKAWAVIGPLVGVLIGAYIANRNQRKQWQLESKRVEYRELLNTLTECGSDLLAFPMGDPQSRREFAETVRRSVNTIYNRLFAADTVIRLNLMVRWREAVDLARDAKNTEDFRKRLNAIMNDIRREALKDLT
jgi:hypothetical protein